jgi:Na+-driven multidrug efflux pump
LMRLASPVVLEAAVESVRWLVFFLILEEAGEDVLAGSGLVYACFAVLLIPAYAFRETAYSLVSRVIGEGRREGPRALVARIGVSAYAITAPLVVAAVFWPETVLTVFTSDPAAIDDAAQALRVMALGMLLALPAEIGLGALLGTGDAKGALLGELILSGVVITGAVVTALVLDLDLAYIWLSVPAAGAGALLFAYRRLRRRGWHGEAV